MTRMRTHLRRAMRLLAVVAVLLLGAARADGTVSVGACCLVGGQCQSLTEFDCSEQGGSFAGADTSCAMIECRAPAVGAPALSLLGLVAALGALAALALYRLLPARRR